MKKFLGFLAILLIATFPVLSQDSPPATIDLSYTILGGCTIELSAYSLIWSAIELPILEDGYVSADDVPILIDMAWKLDNSHEALLKAETGDFLRTSDSKVMAPEVFFQAIYAGDIMGTFPFPATADPAQLIWESDTAGSRASASLDVQFWNGIGVGSPGNWTGSYVLTLYDEIKN